MVCDTITYHPTLTKLINFLETNNGRDKLLRTLQYVTKLLAYYLLRTGSSVNNYYLVRRLQDLFTLSRKPLRALKPLKHLKALSVTVDNELGDGYTKLFESVKQASYSLYYGFDTVHWLKMLGLLRNRNGKLLVKVEQVCSFFWLVALVSGLLQNVRQLRVSYLRKQELLKELASGDDQDPLDKRGNLEKQKETLDTQNAQLYKAKRDLVIHALNSLVAINGLSQKRVNNGVAGGAGVITSILQLQDLWNATSTAESSVI
ncbi:hypothetical protein KL938_000228 [Ogataea parapolymorpha]|nr:hypothetical protein KL938_000228 [Ogataea parapolymorpha]